MKYPDEITVHLTKETDAKAAEYMDNRNCRLCEALKPMFPKADINVFVFHFQLDDVTYDFDNEDGDAILQGYNKDGTKVRKNAKPVTVVARRAR